MLYRLLTTTAVVLALSSPAFAGSTETTTLAQTESTQPAQPETGMQAPAEMQEEPATTAPESVTEPPDPMTEAPAETQPATEAPETGMTETEQPATGSDQAVVDSQAADEWRAGALIGMTVTNSGEDGIGSVKDLVFGADGNISAVVVSIGGFLGIGEKLVAVPWDSVEIDEEQEMVFVRLSKEELEAAPAFRTKEDIQAEQDALLQQKEAEQMQQQQQPSVPATE